MSMDETRVVCPACGVENRPIARFCKNCAAPLAPARPLRPIYGQATHAGRRRPLNEDAVVSLTFDRDQVGDSPAVSFFLVADGMGGHAAGDLASRAVNQIVTDWIVRSKVLPDLQAATRVMSGDETPAGVLTQAIRQANAAILQHGQAQGSDLGSTVVAALILGDTATIANVGDSRAYLLRERRLEQITRDHSLAAQMMDAGVIPPEQARAHPQRSRIYRCLGHAAEVEVDIFERRLQAGDALLLCSDGLWGMVADAEMRRIVQEAHTPQQACDALVEAANAAGGEDNISVIIAAME